SSCSQLHWWPGSPRRKQGSSESPVPLAVSAWFPPPYFTLGCVSAISAIAEPHEFPPEKRADPLTVGRCDCSGQQKSCIQNRPACLQFSDFRPPPQSVL